MAAPQIPAPLAGLGITPGETLRGWCGGFRRAFAGDLVRRRVMGCVAAGSFPSGQHYTLDLLHSAWRLSAPGRPLRTIEGQGLLSFARALYGQDEGALAVHLLETLDGAEFDAEAKEAIAAAVAGMMARRCEGGERAPS